ncbi:uncharacterized protein LOC113523517 [Galleria mellonella]|uniref:Uncharacterized protein LOC113523517 n=1 Tax=Galleria mellonella TaxID=7137 RepID=A0ABM3M9P6_GALME|nr:uncharacterized protein LOC113523517 [Galleria mellonella]
MPGPHGMCKCCVIIFQLPVILRTVDSYPWNKNDEMTKADKNKLKKLAMELVLEANLKIRQVLPVRDLHADFMAFDVGVIMGNSRMAFGRTHKRGDTSENEQQLKRNYRKQFLLRKMGLPANSTTKKRFLHQWPVESSWTMGLYDDLGL